MSGFPDIGLSGLDLFLLRFAFFGFGLGLLMACGQLLLKNRNIRNNLLSMFFLCLAVIVGYGVLVISGTVYRYPHLAQADLPFLYSFGPVLYLLFSQVVDENYEVKKRHLVFFLPLVAAMLFMLPQYLQPAEIKQARLVQSYRDFNFTIPDHVFIAGITVVVLFLCGILRKGFFLLRADTLRSSLSARILLLMIFFTVTVNVTTAAAYFFRSHTLILASIAGITAGFIASYITGRRNPEFFQELQQAVMKEKYRRSLLTGMDLENIRGRLERLMEEQKLYEDDELSLADLAGSLNLTQHQLSQFLNQQLQMNFSSYVNEFRVRAAENMLIKNPELSVLHIAFQVGFNSKSAFNRAFTRKNGMSPSRYRLEKTSG